MSKEDLHIDDFFRKELDDLAATQETSSWDAVSRTISRKRSEKKLFYYSAAAAGLLLLAGSTLLLLHNSNPAATNTPSLTGTAPDKGLPLPVPKQGYASTDTFRQSNNIHAVNTNRPPYATAKGVQSDTGTETLVQSNPIPEPSLSPGLPTSEKLKQEQALTTTTNQNKDPLQHYYQPIDNYTAPAKNTFHTGILVGYQRGFQANTINAPVLSSLFQLDISSKLSLSLQPALAYNKVQKTMLSSTPHYANVATGVEQSSENTPNGTVYHHSIDVSYDSLNVGYTTNSGFWQAELPLYVHYRIAPRLSVFTGAAVRYTSNITIREQISISAATNNYVVTNESEFISQGLVDDIVHQSIPGTPYDASVSDRNMRSGAATVSVLYGLGLKYQVSKRIGLEILGNKNLSGFKHISNKEIRSLHQQPNLRLSIQYSFGHGTGK